MSKSYSRIPRRYDGTEATSRKLSDLLPSVLDKIGGISRQQGDLIMASWSEIIGSNVAKMTEAVSFSEGVLLVKVKNSTLHSLLSQHEKFRLLQLLRNKFPRADIKNIVFRIG